MLDGLELKGGCCVVALGVTTDGVKVPLGLWDGSTENKRVCVELLADLAGRGLDCDQGVLVVLDGGKALRAAVDAVFGHVHVQAAFAAKETNVLDHLPERDRPAVKRRLRAAWKLPDHEVATDRLEGLATELAHSHPGAAASLREGLRETVMLQRLGVHQQLWQTLSSTNPIESMIAICRATSRSSRWPSSARSPPGAPRRADRRPVRQHDHDDRAGRYARGRSLITGSPPRSSTANGTTSGTGDCGQAAALSRPSSWGRGT
jgi:putative transposase